MWSQEALPSKRMGTRRSSKYNRSKFYTWLVRIAVNEALMKLCLRKPERIISLDEEVKTEDDSRQLPCEAM